MNYEGITNKFLSGRPYRSNNPVQVILIKFQEFSSAVNIHYVTHVLYIHVYLKTLMRNGNCHYCNSECATFDSSEIYSTGKMALYCDLIQLSISPIMYISSLFLVRCPQGREVPCGSILTWSQRLLVDVNFLILSRNKTKFSWSGK